MITIEEIEKAHDLPAKKWGGKCYEMACRAADILVTKGIKATPVYGHFLGEIQPSSIFHGRPLVRHGWVLLEDGRVLDPTRWEFEGKEPYLYIGSDEDYDEGGNTFRMMNMPPPPEFEAADTPMGEVFNIRSKLPDTAWGFVHSILQLQEYRPEEGYETGMVTRAQLFWLANLPPQMMDGNAEDIYALLDELDMKGFIPIDNWRMVGQGRA